MEAIRHMATCTNNNRRLARFYRLIFGMEEIWNEEQNSPYAFYAPTDISISTVYRFTRRWLKRKET
jgi:hypothetical protein